MLAQRLNLTVHDDSIGDLLMRVQFRAAALWDFDDDEREASGRLNVCAAEERYEQFSG